LAFRRWRSGWGVGRRIGGWRVVGWRVVGWRVVGWRLCWRRGIRWHGWRVVSRWCWLAREE